MIATILRENQSNQKTRKTTRKRKWIFCIRDSSWDQSPRHTNFLTGHFKKTDKAWVSILILKVLKLTLALMKKPISLFLSGLFGSSEFPLHCVLDTRLLTGKPHALLTTVSIEGCSLPRRGGWLSTFQTVYFFFLGPKLPLSMLKSAIIRDYLLFTTHKLKSWGIITNPAFCCA